MAIVASWIAGMLKKESRNEGEERTQGGKYCITIVSDAIRLAW